MNQSTPSPDDPAEQARYWVVRLASGDMDEGQLARLQHWLHEPAHRDAFERQRALWQSLDAASEAFGMPATAVRAYPRRSPRRRRRWLTVAAGVAAAAILLLMAPEAWLRLRADYRSGIAPQTTALQDGSTLVLDADSAVAVDFDGETRRLRLLRGRAWFDVAKADPRPFVVEAMNGRNRDIGTAFEVAHENDGILTTVSKGLVEVTAPGNTQRQRLHAGQSVRYLADGTMRPVRTVAIRDVATWRDGEILLDAVAVRSALQRIARYRGAPVLVLGKLDDRAPITGTFRTTLPDAAIQAIAERARLRVSELPGGALLIRPQDGP